MLTIRKWLCGKTKKGTLLYWLCGCRRYEVPPVPNPDDPCSGRGLLGVRDVVLQSVT